MPLSLFAKKIHGGMERHLPALLLWCRLPGLISWVAVSVGVFFAFFLPYGSLAGLTAGRSAVGRLIVMTLIASLGITGLLARIRFVRFTAFLIFAFLLCCTHRARQLDVYDSLRPAAEGGRTITITGKVCSAPLPYYENFHFLLRVDSVAGVPDAKKLRGITLNCVTPSEPPQYGTVVARGVFSPPEPRRNPFEYDDYAAQMARGVWGTFTASFCETAPSDRRTFYERLAVGFRGIAVAALRKVRNFDNRALLQASFLGDTEFLSPYIKTTFRKSGIYHLIAISGLNTAMLISALYFFLRLFPIGRTATRLICVVALWAYLPFVGMIPSLFRATVMATLIIAAQLFEKKNYPLHTLGLAGTLWLILSPESLFIPGYQLSFAATAGLFLLFPVLDRFTPRPENALAKKAVSFLFSSLFISIASFLSTMPILLYHFGTISYFGLVANLVAVSAMTVSMWAFFAGLLLQAVLPPLAAIPLWVAERFLDIVVGVGNLANHVAWSQVSYPSPWPEMIVVVAIVLAGFAAINKEILKRYSLFAVLGLGLFIPADLFFRAAGTDVEAVRFAVKGISAAGIRWPGGDHWLIVADAKRLNQGDLQMHIVPWLRHTGGGRFDALFVPSGVASDTAGLRSVVPVFSSASLFSFPDSQKASFAPAPRCTCVIEREVRRTIINIGSHGAKADMELESLPKRRKNGAECPSAGVSKSALLLRLRGAQSITSDIVPTDHPLR
jgi:ComEC/Rec2-related protein